MARPVSTWDDKPNDYEHALAIIERLETDIVRLRAELAQPRHYRKLLRECEAEVERLRAELHSVHAHLQHYREMLAAERERCARVCKDLANGFAAIGRSEHGRGARDGALECEAAIRRGEQ